jgi:hypothetical protein
MPFPLTHRNSQDKKILHLLHSNAIFTCILLFSLFFTTKLLFRCVEGVRFLQTTNASSFFAVEIQSRSRGLSNNTDLVYGFEFDESARLKQAFEYAKCVFGLDCLLEILRNFCWNFKCLVHRRVCIVLWEWSYWKFQGLTDLFIFTSVHTCSNVFDSNKCGVLITVCCWE